MPITATTASANAPRDRTPSGIGALPWQYRVFARHLLFDPSLDCALPTPAASSRHACLPFATEDGNLCAPAIPLRCDRNGTDDDEVQRRHAKSDDAVQSDGKEVNSLFAVARSSRQRPLKLIVEIVVHGD